MLDRATLRPRLCRDSEASARLCHCWECSQQTGTAHDFSQCSRVAKRSGPILAAITSSHC